MTTLRLEEQESLWNQGAEDDWKLNIFPILDIFFVHAVFECTSVSDSCTTKSPPTENLLAHPY